MKVLGILENPLIREDKKATIKRNLFDIVYLIGFLCSLIPGPFPHLSSIASLMLFACA